MLNAREGGRERDFRSDTWESSHSGIGFIEFDKCFLNETAFRDHDYELNSLEVT